MKGFIRKKEKIGYGIASLGDTAIYNMLIVYALYYMTDVVKLSPLTAGNIVLVSNLINAASIIVIGFISDRFPIRGRRRIPYMKLSIMPMGIMLVAFFHTIDASSTIKVYYYGLTMIMLMISHSVFMVPYEALGGEITSDSHERTVLRSYARFFMGAGNMLSVVILLPLVESLQNRGVSEAAAWFYAIIAIATIGTVSEVLTCRLVKEEKNPKQKQMKLKKILYEYKEIMKLKPMVILCIMIILVNIANIFSNSNLVYFMKYSMGIEKNYQALVLFMTTTFGIIMTPALLIASERFDKKYVMTACYIFTGTVFMYFGITGIPSLIVLFVYIFAFSVGTSAYWQLIFSLLYDVSDIDEYNSGVKRRGSILAAAKVILRFSNAAGTQLLGMVLFLSGYDQNITEQSDAAICGIHTAFTYVPGGLFILAAICVVIYPVTTACHKEIVSRMS